MGEGFEVAIAALMEKVSLVEFYAGVYSTSPHSTGESLELAELHHSLAVEKSHGELDVDNIPSRKTILDCCLGLVIVDEEALVVYALYTTHLNFRENTRNEFPNGGNEIAETCLTYINFSKLK